MGRYRSWGLDTDRGVGWWNNALCVGRPPMFFTRDHQIAGQARHLCRAHCPVLDACAREAADPGCGPWCAHLRRSVVGAAGGRR